MPYILIQPKNKLTLFFYALLFCALVCLTQNVNADTVEANTIGNISDQSSDGTNSVKIIEPKKEITVAKSAAIDDESVELGLYTGYLAVEEFNANPVFGVALAYHVTPKLMLQLNYGESEVDRATFENLAQGNFLTREGRSFEYYSLLAGYKILRGRSFFGKNSKYNSDIYLFAGASSVDFADGKDTGVVFGSSYRVVLTDYLTMNVDFKGYSVDREIESLDDKQNTLNTELVFGLNVIF